MSFELILQKRNTNLSWRLLSHVLFWLVFYLAFAYYNQISFNPFNGSTFSYLEPVHNIIGQALVFYILIYWVFPNFLFKKRWLLSTLWLISLLVLFAITTYLGETLIINYCSSCRESIVNNTPYLIDYLDQGFLVVMLSRIVSLGIVFQLLLNLMIPIAIKGGLSYHQSYVRNLQLAQDNVQLELNFLKAQLNPHFLFNTLNNLYGLIIQQRTDESAQTVSRLSDFMRYTLYDSSEKYVPLEKELSLTRNYIELEQLRLNQTKIAFETEVDESVKEIPPLLFLPLLENAFKYVSDYGEHNFISIQLQLEKKQLEFTIRNSFDPDQKGNEVGGIGLSNLKKRLALHFPNNHHYECGVSDKSYFAILKINFS